MEIKRKYDFNNNNQISYELVLLQLYTPVTVGCMYVSYCLIIEFSYFLLEQMFRVISVNNRNKLKIEETERNQ